MTLKTYGDLRAEIERECDTEAEDWVTEPEIRAYFQDAINEAEGHIHKLGLEDDYFLDTATYSLTVGQETIDLPENIYATKIRGLTYATKEKVYPMRRAVGGRKFEDIQNVLLNPHSGEYYRYIIRNKAGEGFKIYLFPLSYETTANCIHMDYIRNMNEIEDDSSTIEVPEFYSFVKAYVKWKIYDKENSVKAPDMLQDLNKEREYMLSVLAEMVPDADNKIPMDLSFYEEMS